MNHSKEQTIELIRGFLNFTNKIREDRLETWSPTLKGVKKIDLYILLLIQVNPKMRIGEIGERLDIHNSTLTGIINRLERKRLIERIRVNDRRSYCLKVTEEGRRIRSEHDRILKMIARAILDSLNIEERETFIMLLSKVADGIPGKGSRLSEVK